MSKSEFQSLLFLKGGLVFTKIIMGHDKNILRRNKREIEFNPTINKMLKFSELSSESKNVAIEGFMFDAVSFDFDWDGMNRDEVEILLSSNSETQRYNAKGIVIGKVEVYETEEVFYEGGMY